MISSQKGPPGSLWYDDDPSKTVEQKVKGACKLYKRKFKRAATVVCVHPSAVCQVDGVEVVPKVWMLRHHYFAYEEES